MGGLTDSPWPPPSPSSPAPSRDPLPPPAPPTPRPPTFRPETWAPPRAVEPWLVVAVSAGVLAVVAAFLPWITAVTILGDISRNGVDGGGDGILTALLGAAVVIVAVGTRRRDQDQGPGLVIVICSLIVAAVSVYDLFSVNDRIADIDRRFGDADVGIGLYLTILAGIGGVVAGVLRIYR